MNERLEQLALQAGMTDDKFGMYFAKDKHDEDGVDLEKFAELIVRECATAFEAEVDTWKEMDPYQGSIKRQGTKAIKQHFGVEL